MNKEINMVRSWSEMPIGMFQRLHELNKEESDDKDYKVVACLANMTLEQVLDLPITTVHGMVQDTAFMLEKPKKKRAKDSYMIHGRKYNVLLNPNEMTTAQFIDFQTYGPECEKHLGAFLSIFLIPEGRKYNSGYNIEFVHNEITQHFNIEDALSLSAFFLHSCRKYVRRTLLSLEAFLMIARMKAPTQEIREQIREAEKMVREMRRTQASIFG